MTAQPFSEAVAQGVRDADPDALAAVWRAVAPALLRWLLPQVRDAGVAEDLVQETFLELCRSCRGIEPSPRQIRAWLYRAASRNVLDWRRRSRRRPEEVTDDLPEGPASDDPCERAVSAAETAHLQTRLRTLPPKQATVLVLRFQHGYSAPEVARALNTTEGAVRSLQHRGLQGLREALPGEGLEASAAATAGAGAA